MTITKLEHHELTHTRHSLIARLKDWEDQDGWRDFFGTYSELIFKVALKAGLTEAEAHDVVQETVITVAKSIKDFKTGSEHGSFKAWLLNTTRWRIMDQFRKRAPEQQADVRRSPDDTARTPTIERVPAPHGPEIEATWDKEWAQHRINAALAQLKKKVGAKPFQIFQLLVTRDLSAAEVGKILGVSRTLVYVTKHRLSKPFQQELRRIDGETD